MQKELKHKQNELAKIIINQTVLLYSNYFTKLQRLKSQKYLKSCILKASQNRQQMFYKNTSNVDHIKVLLYNKMVKVPFS